MTGRSMPFASSGNRGDLIRPDVSRERPALVDLSASARRWSYAQLDAAAEGFAASLVRTPPPTGEILYTSGSTGRPKGVVLSHAGQLWSLGVHVGATPTAGERSLIVAPLYHMNALFNVSVCLLNAIEVVLMPRFDAVAYLKAAAEYRCTLLSGIPTMFALMARQRELLATLDLSSVKAVTIGSAPLTEAL